MGFASRKPNPNEPMISSENPYGSDSDVLDDTAVLLTKRGKRCRVCKRVILNRYLKFKDGKPFCPDCV